MMNEFFCLTSIVACLCWFGGTITAQSSAQTQCSNATSLTNLTAEFFGTWYEVIRSPASTKSCVALNVFKNSSGLYVNLTSSTIDSALHKTQTTSYSLAAIQAPSTTVNQSNTTNTYGYTYNLTSADTITIKVLSTDNFNYAILCGYSSSNNISNAFGLILTRDRSVNKTVLNEYVSLAQSNYTDFSNSTNVTQTSACYKNSTPTRVTLRYMLFALVYTILKLIN